MKEPQFHLILLYLEHSNFLDALALAVSPTPQERTSDSEYMEIDSRAVAMRGGDFVDRKAPTSHLRRLCERCAAFDVRALFLAAELSVADAGEGKIARGVFRYHQLHQDLLELRSSADRCDLCFAIWQQIIRSRHEVALSDEELNVGVSAQPIYLDLDDWERDRSRAPHVIATQYPVLDVEDEEFIASFGRRLAYFEVCASPGNLPDDHADFMGHVQATCSLDNSCMRLAREWLHTCSATHTMCNRTAAALTLPTRVLDVSRDADTVYLVDGKFHRGQYAALSYCWGGKQDLVLENDTEDLLRGGLALSAFPATLRDAIKVTQKLKIIYIWIDALCILQDSNEDWAREAGLMSQVYRGSAITIEAATARNASDGIAGVRPSSKPYVKLPWVSALGSGKYVQMRPVYDIMDTQLTDTLIFSRGWTLQERLLAPRTLSFGEQQLSYECATGYHDEAGSLATLPRETEHYLRKQSMSTVRQGQGVARGPLRYLARILGIPSILQTPVGTWKLQGDIQITRKNRGTFYDYWRVLVSKFSDRVLTQASDRLPALAGIATEVSRATSDKYCAGLWLGDMILSLAWECGELYNVQGRNGDDKSFYFHNSNISDWPAGVKSSDYLAPSWSWASVRGRVSFLTYDDLPHKFRARAKVIKVNLQPRFQDTFGCLKGGQVDIAGFLLRLPSLLAPCEQHYRWRTLHEYLRVRYVRLDSAFASEFFQHHSAHPDQKFALLQLLTWYNDGLDLDSTLHCLLLQTCGTGGWRRLCLVTLDPSAQAAQCHFRTTNPNPTRSISELAYEEEREEIGRQVEHAPWTWEHVRIV